MILMNNKQLIFLINVYTFYKGNYVQNSDDKGYIRGFGLFPNSNCGIRRPWAMLCGNPDLGSEKGRGPSPEYRGRGQPDPSLCFKINDRFWQPYYG